MMPTPSTYFDLEIQPSVDGVYQVTVVASPAGAMAAPVDVAIDLADRELARWLQHLDYCTITPAELEALGRCLAAYLFPPGIRELYFTSRGIVVDANRQRLQIRLRLAAPELSRLPWEYVYEATTGFLGLDGQLSLLRSFNQPTATPSFQGRLPLAMLVVIANLPEFPPLNVVRELRNLLRALQPLLHTNQLTLDLLFSGRPSDLAAITALAETADQVKLLADPVTLDAFQHALRKGHRIVHYIGHGVFDRQAGGQLVFCAETSAVEAPPFRLVNADTLAHLMRGSTVEVVTLTACDSASEGTTQSFLGLGSRLIRANIPAVIAMQSPITDNSAIQFSRAFYASLADGLSLDAAVTQGRKAIYTLEPPYQCEWGKPVLFLRALDTYLLATPTENRRAPAEAHESYDHESAQLRNGIATYREGVENQFALAATPSLYFPYKGLHEYRVSDAARFFGRTRAIEQLLRCLQRDPLTILHAESGAGKTSLIQAGIVPRLLEAGGLPVVLRPYNRLPTVALKECFLTDLEETPTLKAASLREFLHEFQQHNHHRPLYLFIDQFEEFFTLLPTAVQAEFVQELALCLEDLRLNVAWIFALRSEYFSHLANFHPRIRNPYANELRLNRLTVAEATEAIVRPLEPLTIQYEDGLVARILHDLGGAAVLPPQLQLICAALFERVPSGEHLLYRGWYDELGGAAGILQGHLERVLTRELLPEQRPPARLLLASLVTTEVRRTQRTLRQLVDELQPLGIQVALVKELLASMVSSHLILQHEGKETAEPSYELTHDYLAAEVDLNPNVRARKTAQELLTRGLLNWQLGDLMGQKSLTIIGAQREVLLFDQPASELIVRSTLVTGVSLQEWVHYLPIETVHPLLLDALHDARREVRLRAVESLISLSPPTVGEALAQCLPNEVDPQIRATLFAGLMTVNPARATAILATQLFDADQQHRLEAIDQAKLGLTPPLIAHLFQVVTTDGSTAVWQKALALLATDAARALHHDQWGTAFQCDLQRQGAIYQQLRRLHVPITQQVHWQTLPARVWYEATVHPQRFAGQVACLVLLYGGLAWWQGWAPFLRWAPFPGAPEKALYALAISGSDLYLGSYHYGLAHYSPMTVLNEGWEGWSAAGLPLGQPGEVDAADSTVSAILDIAVHPSNGDRVAVVVADNDDLYDSWDGGRTWQPSPINALLNDADDADKLATVPLAIYAQVILLAVKEKGLWGSDNDGLRWQQLITPALTGGSVNSVTFSPTGVPYVGAPSGLYRGSGEFPWQWEKVATIPYAVFYLAFGPADRLYVALGVNDTYAADTVVCYTAAGAQVGEPTRGSGDFVSIDALAAHPWRTDLYYYGESTGKVFAGRCADPPTQLPVISQAEFGINELGIFDWQGQQQLLQVSEYGLWYFRID